MNEQMTQLASEPDRLVLREYLTKRLQQLKREEGRAGEKEEAAYCEGAIMEIELAFDELLGEESPAFTSSGRLAKQAVGH